MSEKVKVLIGLPNEGWHHKYIMTWAGHTTADKELQEKYQIDYLLRETKPIDNNRNHMVQDALKNEYDFLLFCDADNPPYRNPIPLVDLDLDIIACPTPVWNAKRFNEGGFPIYLNCMDRIENRDAWTEHFPQHGLQEIDAAGTGCMIIARRVLEHPDMKPAFKRRWTEEGTVSHGSDFEFCRRAKEAGFKIWAHYDFLCHHFKELDIWEILQIMKARDISSLPRKNKNTKEYWDGQWGERKERIIPPYKTILDQVSESDCVLDFGCGRGDLLNMLHKKCSYAAGVDISQKAVDICAERGLTAFCDTEPRSLTNGQKWDAIVCTEVLEHLDDDIGMIEKFFEHTDRVIFSVPNNCLPPGMEPEHRRVYTYETVINEVPHFKRIIVLETYMVVIAEKEAGHAKPVVSERSERDAQLDLPRPECLNAQGGDNQLDRDRSKQGSPV